MAARSRKPSAEFRKPQREKLTVERLDSLMSKPPSDRTDFWDLYCPGLAARVSPKGRITFNVLTRVTTPGGAQKAMRMKVGLYPRISLKEARDRASTALRLVEDGLDPRYERKVEREKRIQESEKARTNTLSKALQDYADQKMVGHDPAKPLRGRYGSETIADLQREFRDDFQPQREVTNPKSGQKETETKPVRAGLANVPLNMVEWRHIQARLDDAIWRGADSRAHHLFSTARGFFNWAHKGARKETYGLGENIFAGQTSEDATHRKKISRDRNLSENELRLIWHAVGEMPDPYRTAVRLLMYTSTRLSDVLKAKGAEFDLREREWVVPKERHKSRKPFLVPLSEQAIELIDELDIDGDAKFIFSTTNGEKPFSGDSKLKTRLDDHITKLNKGVAIPGWTHHDFRRACRTWLAKSGVPDEVAEAVLAHSQTGLRKVYNLHHYGPEKRACLQDWADALDRITSGQHALRAANVVRLKAR